MRQIKQRSLEKQVLTKETKIYSSQQRDKRDILKSPLKPIKNVTERSYLVSVKYFFQKTDQIPSRNTYERKKMKFLKQIFFPKHSTVSVEP